MASTELTLQLGVGQVVWRRPSMVHMLEVMSKNNLNGFAHAKMYALCAGLPDHVLQAVQLSGNPTIDHLEVEKLLDRQGCTVVQINQAGNEAWQVVYAWWIAAMPAPKAESGDKGNEPEKAEASPPALTD